MQPYNYALLGAFTARDFDFLLTGRRVEVHIFTGAHLNGSSGTVTGAGRFFFAGASGRTPMD
jgi:hypothetical protein